MQEVRRHHARAGNTLSVFVIVSGIECRDPIRPLMNPWTLNRGTPGLPKRLERLQYSERLELSLNIQLLRPIIVMARPCYRALAREYPVDFR
jgi:hypothetical protein